MVDKHTVPCIAEKITGPEDISIEMVTWSCACAKSVIISSVLITVRSVSLTLTLEGSIAELNNDRLQDVLATYVPYSPRKTTSPRIPRSALMLVVARVPGLQVKDVNESTHGSTRTRTHGFGPTQTGDPHSREIRRRVDPRSMDLYPWIADRLTSQCTSICSVPHVAHLSVLRMPKCSNLIEL